MELEEIRKKYQCDEGRTFAQWKEWVRKNKPSQAQAHIVKAVAPNGSKYERLIGGYTDAQNTASNLVSHGYKDVKLYHSVNAGPLKLLRNFSAPLHGAKFKDSADLMDAEDKKNNITRAYPYQDILNRFMTLNFGRPRKTQAMPEEKSEVKRAYDLFKKNAGNSKFANEWLPKYKRFFKKFGIILDSADAVDSIRQKYENDGFLNVDKETRRKIISYLKTRWKLDDAKTNRFIRDFDRDLGDLVKDKESWDRITKFIDGRVKKIDVNPYSNSYGHSLIAQKYKKPGKDKLRSKDSEDEVDEIREKYQSDAVGAGVVNPNFKFQTNVEKRLATTRKGRAMTLPQYGKPSKVYVGKDGNFFAVFNTSGQKLSKTPFKTASEAESFARKNGWMVERR